MLKQDVEFQWTASHHKPGKQVVIADALSRPLSPCDRDEFPEIMDVFMHSIDEKNKKLPRVQYVARNII